MEEHNLDIEISPTGKITVHIRGAKGAACMDYTKVLESIVGSINELQHTREYYEPPTNVLIDLKQKIGG
ncbi:MAG: DUF2997 domain-containing protein [Pseudomonadota bacterium]